jgi:hypothetical protein
MPGRSRQGPAENTPAKKKMKLGDLYDSNLSSDVPPVDPVSDSPQLVHDCSHEDVLPVCPRVDPYVLASTQIDHCAAVVQFLNVQLNFPPELGTLVVEYVMVGQRLLLALRTAMLDRKGTILGDNDSNIDNEPFWRFRSNKQFHTTFLWSDTLCTQQLWQPPVTQDILATIPVSEWPVVLVGPETGTFEIYAPTLRMALCRYWSEKKKEAQPRHDGEIDFLILCAQEALANIEALADEIKLNATDAELDEAFALRDQTRASSDDPNTTIPPGPHPVFELYRHQVDLLHSVSEEWFMSRTQRDMSPTLTWIKEVLLSP